MFPVGKLTRASGGKAPVREGSGPTRARGPTRAGAAPTWLASLGEEPVVEAVDVLGGAGSGIGAPPHAVAGVGEFCVVGVAAGGFDGFDHIA
jgi:hypothetical protein